MIIVWVVFEATLFKAKAPLGKFKILYFAEKFASHRQKFS